MSALVSHQEMPEIIAVVLQSVELRLMGWVATVTDILLHAGMIFLLP